MNFHKYYLSLLKRHREHSTQQNKKKTVKSSARKNKQKILKSLPIDISLHLHVASILVTKTNLTNYAKKYNKMLLTRHTSVNVKWLLTSLTS